MYYSTDHGSDVNILFNAGFLYSKTLKKYKICDLLIFITRV